MLFEIIFFLNSYSRRSLTVTFFGWNGLSDTFTKTWSGELSCVFVVSSLPAIVVDDSKSFSFPGCSLICLWLFLPLHQTSASLVHGFTHNKSVPYLFSTPQTRCQQQTEILIHLLKKLAPVNDISSVLNLVDPIEILSANHPYLQPEGWIAKGAAQRDRLNACERRLWQPPNSHEWSRSTAAKSDVF